MLAACGEKENPLYHMRCSQIDLMDVSREKTELDPHNTVTAVYHFDGRKRACLYRIGFGPRDLGGKMKNKF